jgi:peroxiredoxin Q/BCP
MKRMKIFISLSLIIITMVLFNSFFSRAQDSTNLAIGDTLPSFELTNDQDEVFKLTEHIGKNNLIIYFYPKDDTPGCTKEACAFRDGFEEFSDLDAEIIGISADSPQSHRDFKSKYELPFILLSDPDNKVRDLFGIKKDLLGIIPGRVTFVVDKKGIVQFIYNSQTNAEKHVKEAMRKLIEMEK